MAGLIMWAVWSGGVYWLIENDKPYWRSIAWPFFLGKAIARKYVEHL